MTFHTRTTCRLCDSSSLEIVLSLPDTPLANELPAAPLPSGQDHFPLYVVQCQACEHVQLPIVVDPKRLFGEYRYVSGTSATFRAHLEEQAATLACGRPPGRVVEIGSNDGTLLDAFRRREWSVLGVDPAAALAFGATERGSPTIPGFFTGQLADQLLALFHGPADLVVANNVFAHADDLHGIAAAARRLIGRQGTFVFEVAYLPEVLRKNAWDTIYHEHLSHHHVAPLHGFLKRAGMLLGTARQIDAQGGSIRCFASAEGRATLPPLNTVDASLDKVDVAGWPERIQEERVRFFARAGKWLGKGAAIYGCPARLTTWTYTMGLRAGDISCVFDDNPHKIGRYTPGLFWPIVSSAELMQRDPPAIIVAAWPYIDEIKAKFPDYRGEWVAMR